MGSAWKQLPDDLSVPAKRLTEELRAVKDATGLSLSELASRTHYSRASWERWLNGKRIITEQALDALTGAVECDGPTLRALWEQTAADAQDAAGAGPEAVGPDADATGPDTDAVSDAAGPVAGPVADADAAGGVEPDGAEPDGTEPDDTEPDDTEPAGLRAVRWWRRPVALLCCAAAAAVLVVLAGVHYSRDGGTEPAAVAQPAVSSTTASPARTAPATPSCQAMGCAHKDPKATGCGADARTLLTGNIGKVVVYLRYSDRCQAAWAAITEGAPNDYSTITSSGGETETALIHWGYDNYSAMVNAADPAATFQVCGHTPAGNDCTGSVSGLARLVASTPIPIGPASPPATPATPAATPTPTATAAGS
ncbi:DUF2690 domain-containing protein [Kitasatospora sp. NPDC003701]